MAKQLRRYAFTLNEQEDCVLNEDTIKEIKSIFRRVASRWVFQLEEGEESHRKHLQGRVSFKQAKRVSECAKVLPFKAHYSPEHDSEAGDFYVTKEETRVEGPWSDKDQTPYIPRQIREVDSLLPWQQSIVDSLKVWDTRTINILYDPNGNIGKSTICGYIRAYQLGRVLPPVNDIKDLLRMVCDMPTNTSYLFDMPKSQNKDRLYGFFSGVETLKDGYAYDDRYTFKEKIFDCPNIWIFTNKVPDTEYLSMDRWKLWTVENKRLTSMALRCNSEVSLI